MRPGEQFADGHVPGSINIALSGQFASWAGALLGLGARPVLIAESENEVLEGRMRLARVGLEGVGGYLKDGVSAWAKGGLPFSIVPQIGIDGLRERFRSDRLQVLDVRREAEWKAGHIENALWWPLDNFRVSPPEIDRDRPVAVHCKSGYRSMIACSLLQRAGFADVRNVAGGFDAWEHAKLPVVVESTINA